ncbi:MAG: hypothetical protein ABII22_05635 [Candidatus Micrarchaeota archaeon]
MECYTFEPCASSNSFEAKFKKRINLDKVDFGDVIARTDVVILLNIGKKAVSIYASGKLMLKDISKKQAKDLTYILCEKLTGCGAFED